jgi:hypothetical protein
MSLLTQLLAYVFQGFEELGVVAMGWRRAGLSVGRPRHVAFAPVEQELLELLFVEWNFIAGVGPDAPFGFGRVVP